MHPPLPPLPARLPAPAPSWHETSDVVVVGSGIAGLTTALHLRRAGWHVTVVTKVHVDDGSTRWAQGGIAAVLDPLDTPAAHAADTHTAGAGLCDPAAVEVLVAEGPQRVRELIRQGAAFDRHPDGSLQLTREGGHRADRIAHAGGDATGAEVQRALQAAVRQDPWIRLIEHALVVDLLVAASGQVCGVTLHVLGEGTPDGVGAVLARAVVLATGGIGQIFDSTTNPPVSTGDGVALALRAGATVADLEFIQFHPTALAVGGPGGAAATRAPEVALVSEALRGEGAWLVDEDGKRFLLDQHEQAELAPRDVVAKAIHRQLQVSGLDHVWLDARHLGGEFLQRRFPTIVGSCRVAGIEPGDQLIPVATAAHYASGGVRTDLVGRTGVPGLYACGEVACTGVHGANRLASNSLLEALVFAHRIAADIARDPPVHADPMPPDAPAAHHTGLARAESARAESARAESARVDSARAQLQAAMSAGGGVLRAAGSLSATARMLGELPRAGTGTGTEAWELANLLTVAAAVTAAGYARAETRGCHWREDHPGLDDRWRGHLSGRLSPARQAGAGDPSYTLAWERA